MPYLLFVDDDSNVLNINRNYFESRGFSVSVAQTADQALDHVKKYPVDCVVLDIMMPGFDGFLLCRRFKTQMTAPVIFSPSPGTLRSWRYGSGPESASVPTVPLRVNGWNSRL